jgi:hypothetical protein
MQDAPVISPDNEQRRGVKPASQFDRIDIQAWKFALLSAAISKNLSGENWI